ncbi:hypothetical protein MTO96_028620 [Rhipicephalus appendiculatus]
MESDSTTRTPFLRSARVQQEPGSSRDIGQELVSKRAGAQLQCGALPSSQPCGKRHSGFVLAEPPTNPTLRSRLKIVSYAESRPSSSRVNMRKREKRRRSSTDVRSPVSTNERHLRKRPRHEQASEVGAVHANQRGYRSANGREKHKDRTGSVSSATAGMPKGTGENQRGPRRSSHKRKLSMNANSDGVTRASKKRRVSTRPPRRTSNSKAKKRKQDSPRPSTTSGAQRSKRRRTVATTEPADIPAAAPAPPSKRGSRKRLRSTATRSTGASSKPAAKKQRRSRSKRRRTVATTEPTDIPAAAPAPPSKRGSRKRQRSTATRSTSASSKPAAKKQRRPRNEPAALENGRAGLRATGRTRGGRMRPMKASKKRGRESVGSAGNTRKKVHFDLQK